MTVPHRTKLFCLMAPLLGLTLSGPVRAGAWETSTIADMEVHLYLPSNPGTIGDGRALLVVLHGCTQPNEALRDSGNLDGPAEEYGMAVAVPDVPGGGVVAGCWDYYGAVHTRENKHNGNLIEMVQALTGDPGYAIDPNQVYITGLSSGGGEVAVIGCLAPDVFAGIGIVSGPAAGTSLMEFANKPASLGPDDVAATCTNLAGAYAGDLSTQLASVFQPEQDPVVDPDYAECNAQAYALLYSPGGGLSQSSFPVEDLPGSQPRGEGTLWSDELGSRVSLIMVPGVNHGWPAGSGTGGGSFILSDGVHYAAYLAEFFYGNNLRVGSRPLVEFTVIQVAGCCVDVAGTVTDPEGHAINSLRIEIDGTETSLTAGSGGSWSHQQCDLSPGTYAPVVTAINDRGAKTIKRGTEFSVDDCGGSAPQISIIDISVSQDCVSVTGIAADPDGDIQSATIAFDAESPTTLFLGMGGTWDHNRCGLSLGEHTVLVSATDLSGLTDTADARFSITGEDNSPPWVSIDTLTTSQDCVQITGRAGDPDGDLPDVSLTIDDQPASSLSLSPAGEWDFEQCGLEVGEHEVVVTAVDQALLEALAQARFEIAPPGAPSVSMNEPVVSGACVNLSGSATDPEDAVLTVTIKIDNRPPAPITLEPGGGWSYQQCALSPGLHTAKLTAADPFGLKATVERSFTIVSDQVDQPPQVSIDDIQVNGNCVNLEGTAIDPDGDQLTLFVTIDDIQQGLAPPDQQGTWSYQRCDLAKGGHLARVTATDVRGLQSSDSVEFNIGSGKGGGCTVVESSSGQILWPLGLLVIFLVLRRRISLGGESNV